MSDATKNLSHEFRIRGVSGFFPQAWKVFAVVGALGLVLSFFGYTVAPERFAFAWLFAFAVALTIGLGAIIFVLVQYLSVAGWSVTVRRTAEFFLTGIFVLPLLFAPLLIPSVKHTLYPWVPYIDGTIPPEPEHAANPAHTPDHAAPGSPENGQEAAEPTEDEATSLPREDGESLNDDGTIGEDHIDAPQATEWDGNAAGLAHTRDEALRWKSLFFRPAFYYSKMAFYFLFWCFVAWRLFTWSVKQDTSRDPLITKSAQRWAPLMTIGFALTLTFAAFDWIMSLEPTWYSTIYGVYIFAGTMISMHAIVILVTLGLRNAGYLGKTVNEEHYHDLGKMLFGFVVFWAYIGFSQFMLIWYASIPEETTFFHHRWLSAGWRGISLALLFAHFVLPFLILISRNSKRRLAILGFGAGWMLVVHVLDIYWLVMPYADADGGFHPHWVDLACFFGVVGTFLSVVFFNMSRHSLVAVGDPRIGRAMRFHNA